MNPDYDPCEYGLYLRELDNAQRPSSEHEIICRCSQCLETPGFNVDISYVSEPAPDYLGPERDNR